MTQSLNLYPRGRLYPAEDAQRFGLPRVLGYAWRKVAHLYAWELYPA